jgi:putative nucleotidyltransferase with HDIG domain
MIVMGVVISLMFAGILILIESNFNTFSHELYIGLKTEIDQTLADGVQKESERLGNIGESHSYWTDLLIKTGEKDTEWIELNATRYLIENASYNIDSFYIYNTKNGYEDYYSNFPKQIFSEVIQINQENPIDQSYVGYLVATNSQLYILDLSLLADSEGLNPSGFYIVGHRIDEHFKKDIQYIHASKATITLEINATDSISVIPMNKQEMATLVQQTFKTTITNSTLLNRISTYTSHLIQIVAGSILMAVLLFMVALMVISINMKRSIQTIQYLTYHDFSKKIDLNFSKEFTDLSHCINNLSAELQIRDHNINQKYVEIITILIAALEAVDVYTKGHSERVSHYSVELAKSIQYEDIESIRLSGLLHDIGKISVDTKILNKPSGLTPAEFEEIKRHPVISYQILEASDIFKDVKNIVKYHHEKIDGTGYPDGLIGEAIPLGARIVAIADVFDSLTSKRSYRDAMSVQDALSIIENSLGSHFDPDLVHAFLPIAKSVYASWSDLAASPVVDELLRINEKT